MSARLVVWQVTDTAGFDAAWVQQDGPRFDATGQAVAQRPGYSAAYRVDTDEAGVTRTVDVTVADAAGTRRVELRRAPAGWTADGAARPDLADALDVDLQACPATNTMPIVRHGLHRGPGDVRLTMAFVRLPSLEVVPHVQRYEHLALVDGGGAVVRYTSAGFTADLVVDADGVVIDYPQLARRVEP